MERFLRNLGTVEGYLPGPSITEMNKVLPVFPWGLVLRQGKTGKSLTATFYFARKAVA